MQKKNEPTLIGHAFDIISMGGKVCIRAWGPNRPELIPVSVA